MNDGPNEQDWQEKPKEPRNGVSLLLNQGRMMAGGEGRGEIKHQGKATGDTGRMKKSGAGV